MSPSRLAVVVSFFCFAHSVASRPTAPTAQTDPQAAASLQAALAALGGLTAQTPRSLVATGNYTRQPGGSNQSLPIKIEVLGAQSIRWDTNDTSGPVTIVVSPNSSWMQGPDGNRALAVGETFGRGAEIFPLLMITRWLGTPGVQLGWAGAETSAGKVLNHTTVVPPTQLTSGLRMADCEFWSDAQTNLPTRMRVNHSPTDRRVSIPLDLDFSDYRLVNGVLFPFSITFSVGPHVMGQIQFESITVDAPVSPNDFVPSAL